MFPQLLTRHDVAKLLGCSARHVDRMAVAEKMPGPVRLGALVRWDRTVIERWIAKGCLSCREEVVQ
jgi:excisionase family DNA binding protein